MNLKSIERNFDNVSQSLNHIALIHGFHNSQHISAPITEICWWRIHIEINIEKNTRWMEVVDQLFKWDRSIYRCSQYWAASRSSFNHKMWHDHFFIDEIQINLDDNKRLLYTHSTDFFSRVLFGILCASEPQSIGCRLSIRPLCLHSLSTQGEFDKVNTFVENCWFSRIKCQTIVNTNRIEIIKVIFNNLKIEKWDYLNAYKNAIHECFIFKTNLFVQIVQTHFNRRCNCSYTKTSNCDVLRHWFVTVFCWQEIQISLRFDCRIMCKMSSMRSTNFTKWRNWLIHIHLLNVWLSKSNKKIASLRVRSQDRRLFRLEFWASTKIFQEKKWSIRKYDENINFMLITKQMISTLTNEEKCRKNYLRQNKTVNRIKSIRFKYIPVFVTDFQS